MNEASNQMSPAFFELNRALKKIGLRPLTAAAFSAATAKLSEADLVESAKRSLHDERARQWCIEMSKRAANATGGELAPREDSWSPLVRHVWGNQAALCFEPTESASKFPTIAIDAALKHQGARNFDWAGKIQINLSEHELVAVAATLLGFLEYAEGHNHGPAKNKGFRITNQGAHFFIEISEGSKPKRAVRMSAQDAHYVTGLVMRQLQNASPWLAVSDIVTMVRCRVPMLRGAQEEEMKRKGQRNEQART